MTALVLIDVQLDFLPGGALPVPDGDEVIPVINALTAAGRFDLVVATQDWHPPGHASFAANHPGRAAGDVVELDGLRQVLWPVHCVHGTPGAALAPGLDQRRVEAIFRKGTDPRIDSYSAFFDNAHRKDTGLAGYLRGRGVTDVYIAGLATDYCVKFSALDACQLGLGTYVVEDATMGVNLAPGDVANALEEARAAGVHIVRSGKLGSP